MVWAYAILGVALPVSLPQGPVPSFTVTNPGELARKEVVLVSVPYPAGALPEREPMHVMVRGEEQSVAAPAVPLMHWRDGTVAVLQVHAALEVPPGERLAFRVEPLVPAGEGLPAWPSAADSALARPLPLHTELVDVWGRTWTAGLEPDEAAGPGGVVTDSGLVRIVRFRSRHMRRTERGSTEAFLGLRAWLTLFGSEDRGELTLVLDNADLPGPPLGPVRFKSFALVSTDPALRFLPRFVEENGLRPPELRTDGGFCQFLLGPARNVYLGDQTAKAFRFSLYWQRAEAGEEDLRRAQAAAVPLRPLPDLDWVRHTRAFSAHGGPAPRVPGETGNAGILLERWRRTARFGPFSGFGDPEDAAVQGTARNGPAALHNVVRWSRPELMYPAEGMVLQQTLRPTPGRHPALPDDMAPFRQGLGRLARSVPHGMTALDYEHFSVNLLFDWYWLTGDPLARHELARQGRGLRAVLESLPFRTSRGEGWCMQSGTLIARATGDAELADWLRRRFVETVLPEMGDPQRGFAIAQPPHPVAMGDEPFDAPWQMAALVHGLHALHGQVPDDALAAAAVRVAETMARAGWVDGTGPKYFVSARDPNRYTMPAGFEPGGGTAWMELGAFVLAAELTEDVELQQLFDSRARFLLAPLDHGDVSAPRRVDLAANPWLQLALDRRERGQ